MFPRGRTESCIAEFAPVIDIELAGVAKRRTCSDRALEMWSNESLFTSSELPTDGDHCLHYRLPCARAWGLLLGRGP
jgi:hypothetical protein